MSEFGTKRTWRHVCDESGMRNKSGRPPTTPNLWVHAQWLWFGATLLAMMVIAYIATSFPR
jgi:hypothetical protein